MRLNGSLLLVAVADISALSEACVEDVILLLGPFLPSEQCLHSTPVCAALASATGGPWVCV